MSTFLVWQLNVRYSGREAGFFYYIQVIVISLINNRQNQRSILTNVCLQKNQKSNILIMKKANIVISKNIMNPWSPNIFN